MTGWMQGKRGAFGAVQPEMGAQEAEQVAEQGAEKLHVSSIGLVE